MKLALKSAILPKAISPLLSSAAALQETVGTAESRLTRSAYRQHANARLGPKGHRCAPIVGARNYSQPHSQEARVGRLVPIVIVTAIDIFYRLGDLVGVLPDIVQRGDRHCVELTE